MKKAILVVSHGSRSEKTRDEVDELVAWLRGVCDAPIIASCYLEVMQPDIPAGIADCVGQGATRVLLVMNFLNSGNHVLKDIPSILHAEKKKYPSVEFKMTPHIGSHPKMKELYLDFSKL